MKKQEEIKVGQWCQYKYKDGYYGIFKYDIPVETGGIVTERGLGVNPKGEPFQFQYVDNDTKFKPACKTMINRVFKAHKLLGK